MTWGLGFIATRWTLGSLSPLWLTAVRFVVAVVLALPLLAFLRRRRPGTERRGAPGQLWLAVFPGLLVAALLLCQTVGLRHTSVANSSFITTLYVVMVPLLQAAWSRKRVPGRHWLLVIVALLGTALICGVWSHASALSFGDGLTLLAAFFGAVHILVVDALGERVGSAFRFNVYQTLWAGLASILAALALEGWPPLDPAPWTLRAVVGLLFLVVACTLVGYALQVKSQRSLPPVVASLLFLLESPFATLFGWLLLAEAVEPAQAAGAGLIFLAAVGAALSGGKASVDLALAEAPPNVSPHP